MSTRIKTRYIAENSLFAFARRHPLFYFWSFTFADNIEDKTEAQRRFKPLADRLNARIGPRSPQGEPDLRPRAYDWLYVWERQKRGAWHLHMVLDKRLDVTELRQWLVDRGWGTQMKAKIVRSSPARFDGRTWRTDESSVVRVVRYLVKYCTKSLGGEAGSRKKVFGGSPLAKLGTVAFGWMPEINPITYLHYWGKISWYDIYGETPSFKAFHAVVRLGVEVTNWLAIDPWCLETLPCGP